MLARGLGHRGASRQRPGNDPCLFFRGPVVPPFATAQNLYPNQPVTSNLESRSHASHASHIKQGGRHWKRTNWLPWRPE